MQKIVIEMPCAQDWIGRPATGDGGRSEELRDTMRRAQIQAMDEVPISRAFNLHLHWETEDFEGNWHWNPQFPVPPGTETIYCVAEWEETE